MGNDDPLLKYAVKRCFLHDLGSTFSNPVELLQDGDMEYFI